MKYTSFLFLLCALSCSINEKQNQALPKGDIVLIFNDMPVNWKYTLKNGGYSHSGKHEVRYFVHNMIPIDFYSDYKKAKDTVVIKDVGRLLEIEHKYKGIVRVP